MGWHDILDIFKGLVGAKDTAGADPFAVILLVGIPMFSAVTVALIRQGNRAWIGTFLMAMVLLAAFFVNANRPTTASPPNSPPAKTSSPPRAQPFVTHAGMALSGPAVVTIGNTPSATACEHACRSNADCVAYTFDQPTIACQLKRQAGNLVPFQGSTSGIKQKAP